MAADIKNVQISPFLETDFSRNWSKYKKRTAIIDIENDLEISFEGLEILVKKRVNDYFYKLSGNNFSHILLVIENSKFLDNSS